MQNFLNLIMNINSITPENAHDILNRVRIIYSSLEQQPLTFAMYKMAEAIMKSKEIN